MKGKSQRRSERHEEILRQALEFRDGGDFNSALKTLSELRADAPDDLDILFYYGTILFHLDRFQEASEVFRTFLESRPKNELASLALFHCLWSLGRRREAVDEMKRFMAISDSREYNRLLDEIDAAWNADEGNE